MKTLIEKDSPFLPLLVLAFIGFVFLSGLVGLAYLGGVFTGKEAVIANDKRIAHETSQTKPGE
jgi:hypothetical protein